MIHDDIADFAAALPPRRAIAGLDLGTRTIGVAVSDAYLSVASPLETLPKRKFTQDADFLVQVAHIFGNTFRVTRDDLVAGAVVAERFAERDVDVER